MKKVKKVKNRYFCAICKHSFVTPTDFIKDRQKHISKGETHIKNDKFSSKPKATVK
jgi:hypothetical protein